MNNIANYKPSWELLFSNVDMNNFPKIPRQKLKKPGVYRWCITKGSSSIVYIGESVEIGRRIYHYKNPGVRQKTNIRINKLLRDYQSREYALNVHLLEFGGIKFNDDIIIRAKDLKKKYARLIIENIVIAYYSKVNECKLLNLTIN
ncbi:hypothetical protein K8R32_02255 [bacterium]|nr:hypothetical protein [bacterium]